MSARQSRCLRQRVVDDLDRARLVGFEAEDLGTERPAVDGVAVAQLRSDACRPELADQVAAQRRRDVGDGHHVVGIGHVPVVGRHHPVDPLHEMHGTILAPVVHDACP